MLAPQQQKSPPGIPSARTKRPGAVHPLERQLNGGAGVRRLQRQAAQLNARRTGGGAPLQQVPIAEPVVQGFWPAALGVAGLAAMGGLAYKWWGSGAKPSKAQIAKGKQRAAMVKAIHARQHAATVGSLLEETEAVARRKDLKITANAKEVSGATPQDGGGHVVNVNPAHPISRRATELLGKDPHLLATARLHELTHVAAFHGYAGGNRGEEYPYNMADNRSQPEFAALKQRAAKLQAVRAADPYLKIRPDNEQEFLKDRLDYIEKFPSYEFDSVVNELVYYTHLKKFPPDSPFCKALVAEARRQQELRQAKRRPRK